MPICQLDPQLASKIAAGEVVERPASVVKELVENAIDAASSTILVELRGGGFDLIRVVDNGSGIPSREIALAFQHHATSKIRTLADLEAVRTLGFRGEALYSIAAVSRVTLVSRTPESESGSFVEMADGKVSGSGSRGASPGTVVSVRNLFYNVPARRKFLKTAEVEGGRVVVLVSHLALAYPEIQFTLISDGRQVFQSSGSGDLMDTLVRVMGLETARQLLPVGSTREADGSETSSLARIAVRGYVSQPHVNRPNRQHLSIFVNRRWVQSPLLSRAVEQAYHTLLPVGRRPVAVIDIRVPPEEVDVNVHPAKSDVKLLREGEVFVEIQRAVRAALRDQATVPPFHTVVPHAGAAGSGMPMMGIFRMPQGPTPADSHAAVDVFRPPAAVAAMDPAKLPLLRILGQVAQTYIIAESPDGVFLIDQHTAHERILYERLMSERARMSVRSQMLLEPLTIELTPRQLAMLSPKVDALQEMGFALDAFGERAYLIRAIPAILAGADAIQAILEIVDLLADEKGAPANWDEALVITLACHGAVRAGKSLTPEEMRQLVEQLEQTDLPRTCPHGRPTLLHISQAQLEREFGRR